MSAFLQFIKEDAKQYLVDAVLIENVLLTLDAQPRSFQLDCKTNIFECLPGANSDFSFITKKKSLRRHSNKLRAKYNVEIEHFVGKVAHEQMLMLADMHKRRWAYESVNSAFNTESRIATYLAYTENKLLTILKCNDEVVAMHYGMLFDKTLLWHTPIINIKYLDYSPLEILLYETALFCSQQELKALDFGLGQEVYKHRFSNSNRNVYIGLIPVSSKGWLCYFFQKNIHTEKIRKNLILLRYKIKCCVKWCMRLNRNIEYYAYLSNNHGVVPQFKLVVIDSFADLYDLFILNNMKLEMYHYQRIKDKNMFLCLVDERQEILCCGWSTFAPTFFVGEINKLIDNKSKMMLYDYVTPLAHRNRGYYTHLLTLIADTFKEHSPVIFAERKNIASNKAIMKAGFRKAIYEVL